MVVGCVVLLDRSWNFKVFFFKLPFGGAVRDVRIKSVSSGPTWFLEGNLHCLRDSAWSHFDLIHSPTLNLKVHKQTETVCTSHDDGYEHTLMVFFKLPSEIYEKQLFSKLTKTFLLSASVFAETASYSFSRTHENWLWWWIVVLFCLVWYLFLIILISCVIVFFGTARGRRSTWSLIMCVDDALKPKVED